MQRALTVLLAILMLAACASRQRNVIPLEGGMYSVTGLGANSDVALRSALNSARATCKPQQKHHIVTDQTMQYKGIVSQDANRALDNAAQKIADATGRFVPTISNDDDYRLTLTFKCES